MLSASPSLQWLGPCWHPAFSTVGKAKQACEKGVELMPALRRLHPMDAIYGTRMLDDLQKYVIIGSYKRKQVGHARTGMSYKPHSWRKLCEKGVMAPQVGTLILHAEKVQRKQKHVRALGESSPQEQTVSDSMLAWQSRLEDSKNFLTTLNCYNPITYCSQSVRQESEVSPQSCAIFLAVKHTERNFMKKGRVRRNVCADVSERRRVPCQKTRLLQRESDAAERNIWHVKND